MANYRAILELVLAGRSYVEIVDIVRCSRRDVSKVKQAVLEHGVESAGAVTDAELVFSRRFGKRVCGDRKAWARRSESAPRPAGVYPACTSSSVMAAVWRRMFGPASCTISALEMIRFRIDSAITASWRDLYQSSGSN